MFLEKIRNYYSRVITAGASLVPYDEFKKFNQHAISFGDTSSIEYGELTKISCNNNNYKQLDLNMNSVSKLEDIDKFIVSDIGQDCEIINLRKPRDGICVISFNSAAIHFGDLKKYIQNQYVSMFIKQNSHVDSYHKMYYEISEFIYNYIMEYTKKHEIKKLVLIGLSAGGYISLLLSRFINCISISLNPRSARTDNVYIHEQAMCHLKYELPDITKIEPISKSKSICLFSASNTKDISNRHDSYKGDIFHAGNIFRLPNTYVTILPYATHNLLKCMSLKNIIYYAVINYDKIMEAQSYNDMKKYLKGIIQNIVNKKETEHECFDNKYMMEKMKPAEDQWDS